MRPYYFTPEAESEIVAQYQAGKTVKTLAAEAGCSDKPILRVLRERDVYERGRPKGRFGANERQVIAERYRAGETLAHLAEAYGCAIGRIHRILQDQDVAMRPARRPSMATEETFALIRTRRAEGIGARWIARELEVPTASITRWLRMMGMPTNTKGRGANSSGWRGGRVRYQGYIGIWVEPDDPMSVMAWKSGYVPEHRLVMAKALGRPLATNETVHHINGDKADNRPENLQLRKGAHGKGVALACLDCGSHNVGPVPLT